VKRWRWENKEDLEEDGGIEGKVSESSIDQEIDE
jgi:hypothetical protein